MAETIGNKGEELNLLIRQGATFGPVLLTIVNPDGTPVNLSDIDFRGQIRKTFDAEVASANFVFEKVDAVAGQIKMSIPASSTATLFAGSDEQDPMSQYVFDIEAEESDGRVVPYFFGTAAVFREITR